MLTVQHPDCVYWEEVVLFTYNSVAVSSFMYGKLLRAFLARLHRNGNSKAAGMPMRRCAAAGYPRIEDGF